MKLKPMWHQEKALEKSYRKRNFAYLMEQGTGKTYVTLADAERLFKARLINAVLVVAPNGVHSNWVRREIPKHMDIFTISYYWKSKVHTLREKKNFESLFADHYPADQQPLRIFAINIDSVNTKLGNESILRFLKEFKVLFVCDESTRIKNPYRKRTRKMLQLKKLAVARRILTGTPITKAPTDLFSQFQFLDDGLLGTSSYRAFVSEFTVLLQENDPLMMGIKRKLSKFQQLPQIPKKDENNRPIYKNVEKLKILLEPHIYRITKEECLDLPPKIYTVKDFELSDAQRKVYDKVYKENLYLFKDGNLLKEISFEGIGVRAKLKQITSGYINIYDDTVIMPVEDNPRMAIFKDYLEDLAVNETPFIVWAMFKEEIRQILTALKDYGITCASYYGETGDQDREDAQDDFQAGRIQAVVCNARAAGIGIEFYKAEMVFYYSFSDDNELRLQSEDRTHRIGTVKSVVYVDLIAIDTIDQEIYNNLAYKNIIAKTVLDSDSMNRPC